MNFSTPFDGRNAEAENDLSEHPIINDILKSLSGNHMYDRIIIFLLILGNLTHLSAWNESFGSKNAF